MKVVIDSSVWVEFFTDGPKAKEAEKFIKHPHKVILPSLVTYEVYKMIRGRKGEQVAVLILAQMERLADSQIPMDQGLAVKAADISINHKLPMADAIIYAASLSVGAAVVTMDAHFKGLTQVEFVG